jgi:hypothetical protein
MQTRFNAMNFETFHQMMQGAHKTQEAQETQEANGEDQREPIENGEIAALASSLCADNCVCW